MKGDIHDGTVWPFIEYDSQYNRLTSYLEPSEILLGFASEETLVLALKEIQRPFLCYLRYFATSRSQSTIQAKFMRQQGAGKTNADEIMPL